MSLLHNLKSDIFSLKITVVWDMSIVFCYVFSKDFLEYHCLHLQTGRIIFIVTILRRIPTQQVFLKRQQIFTSVSVTSKKIIIFTFTDAITQI
jgi:hypothetical protein